MDMANSVLAAVVDSFTISIPSRVETRRSFANLLILPFAKNPVLRCNECGKLCCYTNSCRSTSLR